MSKAISRRDFLKVTGAVGAAGLLAACGGNGGAASSTASSAAEAASVAGLSSDPVTLTMSWWGGESRHNAYQEALKAFSAEHTTITVNPTFAAWSGWEDTMSDQLELAVQLLRQRPDLPGSEQRHRLPGYVPVGRRQAGCLQCCKCTAVRAHLHDRPYLLLEHDHL